MNQASEHWYLAVVLIDEKTVYIVHSLPNINNTRIREEDIREMIMQSIGFLGPAFFLTQLCKVKTPAMAALCMACSQIYVPMNQASEHWYLAVVLIDEKTVYIVDSLPDINNTTVTEEDIREMIMQSVGFLGPAFFLTQLCKVKTPAMAALCMACSQIYVPMNQASEHWYLAVVLIDGKTVYIVDSLPDINNTTIREEDIREMIMQSIGFLGPAFFLMQLCKVKTPAMAALCIACSQIYVPMNQAIEHWYLAVVLIDGKTVYIVDSLPDINNTTIREEDIREMIMQSIGFLGPAFFLTQLCKVKTPAMAALCIACSQG
ncbi:Ascorbate transporter, chloroplastic [Linum perenne]